MTQSSHQAKTLLVGDVMTAVVMALYPSDTLDAARIEMKFGHVRHLPVIDEETRVLGLVSQSDLLANFWREGSAAPVPVAPLMRTNLHLVTPATPILEAIALLIEHRIGCLPVVNGEGKLTGILTEADFLRHVYRQAAGVDYVATWEAEASRI